MSEQIDVSVDVDRAPVRPGDDPGTSGDHERRRRRPVLAPPTRRPGRRARLRRSLASPAALRQAFLVREVLGPPVALRGPTTDRPT